jgi:hypothetical protein
MFKYFVVSIVMVPVLLGIFAAYRHDPGAGRSVLSISWAAFGIFWIALLYYLRFRWQ